MGIFSIKNNKEVFEEISSVSGVKKSEAPGSKAMKSTSSGSRYRSKKMVQTSVVPREKENVIIYFKKKKKKMRIDWAKYIIKCSSPFNRLYKLDGRVFNEKTDREKRQKCYFMGKIKKLGFNFIFLLKNQGKGRNTKINYRHIGGNFY